MDTKATTAPASDATPVPQVASLAAASAADNAMHRASAGHPWSVLPAILLIIVAVAWSLLRQRRKRSRSAGR